MAKKVVKAVKVKAKAPAKAKASPTKAKPIAKIVSKPAPSKVVSKAKPISKKGKAEDEIQPEPKKIVSPLPAAFMEKQKARLLDLRDHLLDQMQGVAQDNLRSRAEGSEGSAFGMHQADAGSDAYEKDFALSLLSQEQDALYEIEEALKRVEQKTYGVCEMSGKVIPKVRLEAIPFARFTVDCQAQLEKENRGRRRWDTSPQFMDNADNFADEDDEGSEEDEKKKERD